nr:hypothetical protein [Nitrosomonas marina]
MVANRGDKSIIARFNSGLRFLACLSPNLLAFQLALRCKQRFHKLTFRAIVKFIVQTFQPRPEIRHGVTQLPVKHGVAGKALEIVEDNDITGLLVFLKIREQSNHAGTFGKVPAACHIITKHVFHNVVFFCRILTATEFLTFQTAAFSLLLGIGHAAINKRFCGNIVCHPLLPFLKYQRSDQIQMCS